MKEIKQKKCPGGVRLEAYWSPLCNGVEIKKSFRGN